ncbi:hypothetical protein F4825DRAFT_458582 [Nemania diffusa]|nr:hypothetical protein F4825DRAFT_458582 [Nemania diffusa]
MDEPSKDLLASFKQLYARGKYADLFIASHEKKYQVRKALYAHGLISLPQLAAEL